MRAILLFPVVDLRTIASNPAAILRRRPGWPTGTVATLSGGYGGEFLTGFGPLCSATPAESDGWPGRRQYVPARSIRLPSDFPRSKALNVMPRRPPRCLSRRLYGSRNGPRTFFELELEFWPFGEWRVPGLVPARGRQVPGTLLDLELRAHGEQEAPVGLFGPKLASVLEARTTASGSPLVPGLVTSGQTQLILLGDGGSFDQTWVSLAEYSPDLEGLYFRRDGLIDEWFISKPDWPNDRRLVLLLTRLHVERVSLARTVELLPTASRALSAIGQTIDWRILCAYVRKSSHFLLNDRSYGLEVPALRALVAAEQTLLGSDWQAAIEIIEPHCEDAASALDGVARLEGMTYVENQYNVQGQAGAVGPNAHVHDVSFTQAWQNVSNSIDLPQLAEELKLLRAEARSRAETPDDDAAIAALGQAQVAAEQGDGDKALAHLARAGKWALGIAQAIGVAVASAAIKTSIGI